MTTPEDKSRLRNVTKFLKQETISDHGKNTCFPTSIINAVISLGSVNTENAKLFQDAIVEDLIAVPDLWDGSLMHINTFDPRIVEIIERYLPIRVGYDSEIGRMITVPRSFNQIWIDLASGDVSYVVTVEQAAHAYAIVGARIENGRNAVSYIDPLDPHSTFIASEELFVEKFHPDQNGWVIATPVRERVKLI